MMERKVIYEGRASIAKYYIGVITYSFFFASVSATGNAVRISRQKNKRTIRYWIINFDVILILAPAEYSIYNFLSFFSHYIISLNSAWV
jgi:hypothetical protein